MRQALRDGSTSLHRALQVVSETGLLPDADVESVERSVLAPSRDGQVLPQRTFSTRLRRAVASVDHRGSAERHEHAKSRRGVFGRLTEDGMGSLTLVATGDVVAAVLADPGLGERHKRILLDVYESFRAEHAAEVARPAPTPARRTTKRKATTTSPKKSAAATKRPAPTTTTKSTTTRRSS